jgi:hypothetical protein
MSKLATMTMVTSLTNIYLVQLGASLVFGSESVSI